MMMMDFEIESFSREGGVEMMMIQSPSSSARNSMLIRLQDTF
jgi:hypothetical protein